MNYSVIKKIAAYFPGTIIPAFLSLLFLKLLSTILIIDEFGKFTYWLTLSTLLSSISSQWISQPMLRFYNDSKMKNQDHVVNWFLKMLILTILLVSIFIFIFTNEFKIYFILLILVFNLTVIQLVYIKLQVQFKAFKFSIYRMLEAILKFFVPILVLIFILNKSSHNVLLLMGVSLIPLTLVGYISHLIPKEQRTDDDFVNTRIQYFSFGIPMIIWFISSSFIAFADRAILKYYHGYDAVAIYSGNYNLVTGGLALILTPITLIAHPALMNLWNNNYIDKTANVLSKFINLLILIGFLFVTITTINKEILVSIFLSEKFNEGSIVIPLVFTAYIISQIAILIHKPLEFKNNTIYMMYAMLIASIINIVFNILLIPKFNYIGASFSMIIGQLSYVILVYLKIKNIIRIEIMPWEIILKNIILISIILITFSMIDDNYKTYLFLLVFSLIYFLTFVKINILYVRKILKIK